MRPLFASLALLALVTAALATDPDAGKTAAQLITSKGYPLEQHWVTTADFYVLGVFRIPHAASTPTRRIRTGPRPVVVLQHGILDSSDTWVLNSAQESLAFILADSGFDVWMTNSRGNKYSRNNTKLSPDQFLGKFWDFSYEQMAQFDVPAVLQYVTTVTGQPKVVFIGHSQGTTQMFAALASNEAEVRSRVALFVALAPVSSLKNCQSLFLRALADLGLDKIVALLGIKEFLASSALLQLLLPTLCESTPLLCETVIYLFTGLNPPNLNTSRFDVYMDHFPSGTSVRAMEHFSQSIRHGSFSRYDFGMVENLIVYGSISPPVWNVSAIDTPTALFYGSQDPLGDVKDVTDLINQMTSSTLVHTELVPNYSHLDFVWGEHINQRVYPTIVQLAHKFSHPVV